MKTRLFLLVLTVLAVVTTGIGCRQSDDGGGAGDSSGGGYGGGGSGGDPNVVKVTGEN